MTLPSFRHAIRLLTALLLAVLGNHARGETSNGWPQFHGVASQGFVPDGTIPDSWTDDDYVWRFDLGARDVGSPIVFGNHVYVMASVLAKPKQIAIVAIDLATGQRQWIKQYPHDGYPTHRRNTFASSTPAADAENVFVTWGEPDHSYLKCLDHNGKEIWSRDFGPWQGQHGFGASPRIVDSMVVLLLEQQAERIRPEQTPAESHLLAVDRATGEILWKTKLTSTRPSYGVPGVYKDQIVGANTGDGLFGLDRKSGKMLWKLPVFSMRCCSSPIIVGDIAIGSAGSGGGGNHLVAVKIPNSNNEKPREVYRFERAAPYVPTSALKNGNLFMISDQGIASCIDAATGESKWSTRIGGNFGASPIIVGEKLLIISLDGKATVLSASDTYEKLGQIDLGGQVGATPAYANGYLLIRVDNELRCLGPKPL